MVKLHIHSRDVLGSEPFVIKQTKSEVAISVQGFHVLACIVQFLEFKHLFFLALDADLSM